jgi:hypothetical protein
MPAWASVSLGADWLAHRMHRREPNTVHTEWLEHKEFAGSKPDRCAKAESPVAGDGVGGGGWSSWTSQPTSSHLPLAGR